MGVHVIKSLQEAAQIELANGVHSRLLQEAASTADFPAMLANTMYKLMLKKFTEYPATWTNLVSDTTNLKDFKEQQRNRLSESDNLLSVEEHGEYKDSSLIDEKIRFSPKKFGRIFGVSWETLVNDDMQEIKKQPERFGRSAARSVDYDVWSYFRSNPVIYDGKNLFDTTHFNAANSGAMNTSLSEAALSAAYAAMTVQKDLKGYNIRITPKYLFASPVQEIKIWKLLNTVQGAIPTMGGGTDTLAGTASMTAQPTAKNFFAGKLTPVFVPWFDTEEWYLTADGGQYDTLEVGFLNGKKEPDLFVQDGNLGTAFERDEIRYKVRMVWGKVALDYRTFYCGYKAS
jgi:hypothetical protein